MMLRKHKGKGSPRCAVCQLCFMDRRDTVVASCYFGNLCWAIKKFLQIALAKEGPAVHIPVTRSQQSPAAIEAPLGVQWRQGQAFVRCSGNAEADRLSMGAGAGWGAMGRRLAYSRRVQRIARP